MIPMYLPLFFVALIAIGNANPVEDDQLKGIVVSVGYTTTGRGGTHKLHCTGVLLNNGKKKQVGSKIVVTTASCAKTINRDRLEVMVNGRTFHGDGVIPHEAYTSPDLYKYNVAIVNLTEPIMETSALRLPPRKGSEFELARKSTENKGAKFVAASWHYADFPGQPPYELRQYKMKIVPNDECKVDTNPITDGVMCVKSEVDGELAGTASGSPLYEDDKQNGLVFLRGMLVRRVERKLADLYVDMSEHVGWIKEQVAKLKKM